METHADQPLTPGELARVGLHERPLAARDLPARARPVAHGAPAADPPRPRPRRTAAHGPTRTVRISDIAMRWGFFHPSRFARQYQERFGELPSDTDPPRHGLTPTRPFHTGGRFSANACAPSRWSSDAYSAATAGNPPVAIRAHGLGERQALALALHLLDRREHQRRPLGQPGGHLQHALGEARRRVHLVDQAPPVRLGGVHPAAGEQQLHGDVVRASGWAGAASPRRRGCPR